MPRQGRKVQKTHPLKTWGVPLALALVLGAFIVFLVTQGGGGGDVGDVIGESHEYTPVAGFQDIHGMALNPEDPDELYVATHHGLMRGLMAEGQSGEVSGADDGQWARVGDVEDDLMGFSMHPTDGDTFWVSGHPRTGGNMGVRQSTDGGFTWTTLWAESVDFHAMTVSPADPDNLWGSFAGKIYRSTDGGDEWHVLADAPGGVLSLTGDPNDAEALYATTSENRQLTGIVRSTDGGETWDTFADVPATGLAIAPSAPDTMYVAGETGVRKSTDAGATWSTATGAFDGDLVGYLAIHPEDARVVYAGTYQAGVYLTADGGESWTRIKAPAR